MERNYMNMPIRELINENKQLKKKVAGLTAKVTVIEKTQNDVKYMGKEYEKIKKENEAYKKLLNIN